MCDAQAPTTGREERFTLRTGATLNARAAANAQTLGLLFAEPKGLAETWTKPYARLNDEWNTPSRGKR
jgi:hypothetical protein